MYYLKKIDMDDLKKIDEYEQFKIDRYKLPKKKRDINYLK